MKVGVALLALIVYAFAKDVADDEKYPQNCHAWTGATCEWEPNLHKMTVSYQNNYNETFYAYITPEVSTFYNETDTRKAVQPSFQGFFGKFINMSPKHIQVHWKSKAGALTYITDIEPFGSAGTATYPGHTFVATPKDRPDKHLVTWKIVSDNSLYYYDPFRGRPDRAKKALTIQEYHLYHIQYQNQAFAVQYRDFTGRDWLSLYGHKPPPKFHMWRADTLGQIHTLTTEEIHFVEIPDKTELERGVSGYGPRPDEITRMRPFRAKQPTLDLHLKALSCSPRVFEIQDFLSSVEVDHLLALAKSINLQASSTRASESSEVVLDDSTRTSRNSWIARNTDMIVDAIHRRAADVLQMPEALLRFRRASEIPEFPETMISIAERLQLVHYSKGQRKYGKLSCIKVLNLSSIEYTPHHDFSMPRLIKDQPSRFATILFYLNDDMEGGETSFPRWVNAETSEALKVKPERGKAILFYNLLPDGNYDERSQHAALPVLEGEKVSSSSLRITVVTHKEPIVSS